MREFNLEKICNLLYSKEIVDYLTLIHEYKGKHQLYIDTEPEVLEKLVEIAKIKSTISSNRIEGIYTDDDCWYFGNCDQFLVFKVKKDNRNIQVSVIRDRVDNWWGVHVLRQSYVRGYSAWECILHIGLYCSAECTL